MGVTGLLRCWWVEGMKRAMLFYWLCVYLATCGGGGGAPCWSCMRLAAESPFP